MTPGPIVLVIVITMTRADVDATWANIYADVGPPQKQAVERSPCPRGQ
jgi:hypothetical protein